ncbi:beta-1,4-N-acetylgalactosaminyltransferase bre-4-like [Liolophura sinensis]|uniref:beta-1,4-N-acetylgalactosaminyltransferase bre-4-like n=1 Tax=Liolophura sinensis TaxID=3198878 RepID=UPI0031585EA7
MAKLRCSRRCRQTITMLVIPFVCLLGLSMREITERIAHHNKEVRREAMARFLKENPFVVQLQNRIASRRIRALIERETNGYRLTDESPVKDIGRNIKQMGSARVYRDIPNCPTDHPLFGPIEVNINKTLNVTMEDVININRDVKKGGLWRPSHCRSPRRVGIVIPFRNREQHLRILLYHLLPLLKRQLLDFQIFVVEQIGNTTFNKGKLMNAGFLEAIYFGDFHCFIFHDVDLIPEDDRILYRCPRTPRHLSVAVDTLDYKLPYDKLVGGVLNMPVDSFIAVNGYSNMFWGWGGEDDEMGERIYEIGARIQRPPANIARYKMIIHKKSPADHYDGVHKLLDTVPKRILTDGLNSIQYSLKGIHFKKLYTHIWIDVGLPPDYKKNTTQETKSAPDTASEKSDLPEVKQTDKNNEQWTKSDTTPEKEGSGRS